MARGLTNAKIRGFTNSFSAYVAWLIERDSEGSVAREDSPTYGKKTKALKTIASGAGRSSARKKKSGK